MGIKKVRFKEMKKSKRKLTFEFEKELIEKLEAFVALQRLRGKKISKTQVIEKALEEFLKPYEEEIKKFQELVEKSDELEL